MLGGSGETCIRCRNAYLGWRELPAAVGLLGSEGQLGKVSGWSKKANTARMRANFSRNQKPEI